LLFVFTLNLGFRLDVLFGVPFVKGSLPRAASRGAGLVLASDFQRTCASVLPSSRTPRSFRKRVQKYYLFFIPQALFLKKFSLHCNTLIISEKFM